MWSKGGWRCGQVISVSPWPMTLDEERKEVPSTPTNNMLLIPYPSMPIPQMRRLRLKQTKWLTCLGHLASQWQSLSDPRFLRERIASRQLPCFSDRTVVGGGLVT